MRVVTHRSATNFFAPENPAISKNYIHTIYTICRIVSIAECTRCSFFTHYSNANNYMLRCVKKVLKKLKKSVAQINKICYIISVGLRRGQTIKGEEKWTIN